MNDRAKKVWEQCFGAVTRALDANGDEIRKEAYGDMNSRFGWTIDHILPKARGGTNALKNLRPLHWLNNAAKGDK